MYNDHNYDYNNVENSSREYDTVRPDPQFGSASAAEHTAGSTQRRKHGTGKKIIAAALVCALLGGVSGGAAVGYFTSTKDSADSPAVSLSYTESAGDESGTTSSSIKATTINVTTNSDETEMTPKQVYETYVNAVVAITNTGTVSAYGQTAESISSGSGFIISSDGYIVTNNHVIEGADTLTVTMTNGEEYEAELIGTDSANDVALIKIDAENLPTVSLGSSDGLEVGEQVAAIGNPLGELTNTLTVGYVSALDREITENGVPINMFQTDCAINSGNSGGPIFDMHGNVIGITTAKYSSSYSDSASIEGIGFCIPIDDAMAIVSDLLQYGYVTGRASMGIACETISSSVTRYYNLPTGVYVDSVNEGSAAETAGIQSGDIITAVDGTEVTSVTALKALLRDYSAGDAAVVSIYRDGATQDLTVTFDEDTSAAESSADTEEDASGSYSYGEQLPSQLFPFSGF